MKSTASENALYSRLVNQCPIYYGWVIMAIGTLGVIMSSPAQTYAVSIFIEHFINDLHISRSWVSTLYTVATLIGSLALFFVGRLYDRWGPRWVVGMVAFLFGLALMFMGSVSNALMLGLGFVALRMLGQGSLTLVSQNTINQWWVARRGMVMGISGALAALIGVGVFPFLIHTLISLYSWQSTFIILGWLLLLVMVPLAVLFLRRRPEDYGLSPDGAVTHSVANATSQGVAEVNWTLPEAMRTPAFWVFTIGLALINMLFTGQFFHMVSILDDNGLPPEMAASVFVPVALVTAITLFGSGLIVDRIPVKVLVATTLFLQALSLPMALALNGVEMAYLYGVILGAISGLARLVMSVVYAMYFGRRYLGTITGFTSTLLIGASALGPMPFGIARDLMGNYNSALLIAAIPPLCVGFASLFVSRPIKPAQAEENQ